MIHPASQDKVKQDIKEICTVQFSLQLITEELIKLVIAYQVFHF